MSAPNSTIILFKNTNLRDSVGDYNTVYFSSAAKFKEWLMDGNNNPLTAPRYVKEFTNQMYTREGEGAVRVQAHMSELYGVDYMCYKNEGEKYDNITYFCFVDKIEYVNDNVTRVYFHEDTWQTWIRVCDVKRGICDRKIVRLGSNREEILDSDELYDVPDYTANGELRLYNTMDILDSASPSNNPWIIIGVNRPVAADFSVNYDYPTYMDVNGGRPDTIFYYAVRVDPSFVWNLLFMRTLLEFDGTHVTQIDRHIYKVMFVATVSESILPAYIVDHCNADEKIGLIGPLVPQNSEVITYAPNPKGDLQQALWSHVFTLYSCTYERDLSSNIEYVTRSALNAGAFGGYSPKNKKMYESPYILYRMKNKWGQHIDLKPLHMIWYPDSVDPNDRAKDTVCFTEKSFLAVAAAPNCYADYEGVEANVNTRISGIATTPIPWYQDSFEHWLNNNRLSIAATIGTAAVGAVAGIAGGAAGLAVGVKTTKAEWSATVNTAVAGGSTKDMAMAAQQAGAPIRNSTMAQLADRAQPSSPNGVMSMLENAGGVSAAAPSSAGDMTGFAPLCEQSDGFAVDVISMTYETAKHVDEMFTMYGYKVNTIDKFEWQGILSKTVNNVTTGRQFWTYYKTADAHVKEDNALAPVPAYAKRRIEEILNGGIRIWRRDYIFNYENDNTTVPTDSFND